MTASGVGTSPALLGATGTNHPNQKEQAMPNTVGDIPTQLESKPCPQCFETVTFTITTRQAFHLSVGVMYLQDIFPELSIDDRERLISGYCGPCWSTIFGEDEES